jgi:hypothetical protein
VTESTHPAPNVLQSRMFGIVAVLASAVIAILIATDAVKPYPTLKMAYLTCAVIGCVGLIQFIYSITVAKRS